MICLIYELKIKPLRKAATMFLHSPYPPVPWSGDWQGPSFVLLVGYSLVLFCSLPLAHMDALDVEKLMLFTWFYALGIVLLRVYKGAQNRCSGNPLGCVSHGSLPYAMTQMVSAVPLSAEERCQR